MRTDRAWLLILLLLSFASQASAPRVEHWAPRGISSPQFESHAAFDPRTGDAYWVESDPGFSGWHLRVAHCTATGWSPPQTPEFAAAGLEADPWFARDGDTLYFISNRSTDGIARKEARSRSLRQLEPRLASRYCGSGVFRILTVGGPILGTPTLDWPGEKRARPCAGADRALRFQSRPFASK